MQAEFSGGVLVCNGVIALRKVSDAVLFKHSMLGLGSCVHCVLPKHQSSMEPPHDPAAEVQMCGRCCLTTF